MTNKQKEIKQNDLHTFNLPISGKKVEMKDVKNADGHMLMKARRMTDGDITSGVYILSELCKINGEKVTPEDILDLDMEDVVALENEYLEQKKKLISMPKT